MSDRVSDVNIFQGSESHFGFSQGNTYPAIARPFGMNFWAPQTNNEGGWFYRRSDRLFQGMRCTHQPSPWIGDYGHFVIMPFTGDYHPTARVRASSFRPDEEEGAPDSYKIYLRRYETLFEVTPTERGAVMRFTFPAESQSGVQISLFDAEGALRIDPSGRRITGYTRANRGGVPNNFAHYFVMQFDTPIESWGMAQAESVLAHQTNLTGHRAGAYVYFAQSGVVTARIATSFISEEQAWRNLEQEIGAAEFETVRVQTIQQWNNYLSRVDIHAPDERTRRTFYTALYRALLFPRMFYEHDASGSAIHYSPYDGRVHEGVMYADNGFWDTYRTVYPFLSLLFPERLSEILNGFLNAYREGGWMPKWASPGYRDCMIGTHSDAIFADACIKNIPGVDWQLAYEAARKNGLTPSDDMAWGREGLTEYIEKGYVALGSVPTAVSCTLDYAYGDYCIAQMAYRLGHMEDAALFEKRAQNYRNVFDPQTGLMRGRLPDGSWETPFNPLRWGGGYVEGSAWQHRFGVPHDIDGLMGLLGGPEALVQQLDQMLTMPPTFEVGSYPYEIHEMSEMAAVNFGQYAHSNQPVHHYLYLYTYAGQPQKTSQAVRRVLTELYSPDALCGDEDNGEMSSWYLLSSLGLYPICPGKPLYTITTPLFSHAHLTLSDEVTLEMTATARLESSPREITHDVLMRGGHLTMPQA
jgi:predicted alpha-1,2-mannosidase